MHTENDEDVLNPYQSFQRRAKLTKNLKQWVKIWQKTRYYRILYVYLLVVTR